MFHSPIETLHFIILTSSKMDYEESMHLQCLNSVHQRHHLNIQPLGYILTSHLGCIWSTCGRAMPVNRELMQMVCWWFPTHTHKPMCATSPNRWELAIVIRSIEPFAGLPRDRSSHVIHTYVYSSVVLRDKLMKFVGGLHIYIYIPYTVRVWFI